MHGHGRRVRNALRSERYVCPVRQSGRNPIRRLQRMPLRHGIRSDCRAQPNPTGCAVGSSKTDSPVIHGRFGLCRQRYRSTSAAAVPGDLVLLKTITSGPRGHQLPGDLAGYCALAGTGRCVTGVNRADSASEKFCSVPRGPRRPDMSGRLWTTSVARDFRCDSRISEPFSKSRRNWVLDEVIRGPDSALTMRSRSGD